MASAKSFTLTTLETPRLTLQAFRQADAMRLVEIINDPRISHAAMDVPSPFSTDQARNWIDQHAQWARDGHTLIYSIWHKRNVEMIGSISLTMQKRHLRGQIGFWFGTQYWNSGYATEANQRMIQYALDDLGLIRVECLCLTTNSASCRVMEKSQMRFEGKKRSYYLRGKDTLDCYEYAVTKADLSSNL